MPPSFASDECQRRVAEHRCASLFTQPELEMRYGTGVDNLAQFIELELTRGRV